MIANILSIAGSDPSGGAGIQADLKTLSALGCYGMAVVTALTAQNTRGVTAVHAPAADFVAAQIDEIFADIRVDAVKIGMLANADIAQVVADRLAHHGPRFIVLDPVMVATSGDRLLSVDAVAAIRERLMPLATLITPNLPEAAVLLNAPIARSAAQMEAATVALHRLGAQSVLLKAGHLDGPRSDDLLYDGAAMTTLPAPRIDTRNTHGTGCTLSSAIAALLPHAGSLAEAALAGKGYLTGALRASEQLSVGSGRGPVHHFHRLWPPDKVRVDQIEPRPAVHS